MKITLLAATLCIFLGGCFKDDSVSPEIIVEPNPLILISEDSITTGEYLGLRVDAERNDIYAQIQALQEKGVSYVQPIGDFSGDLSTVASRLVLYQSIHLTSLQPSDSDVQISVEAGKVKSIFLNNGTKLAQWPMGQPVSSSVRVGDSNEVLLEKFMKIRSKGVYAPKFERIYLSFKELNSEYDPKMDISTWWYFAFITDAGLLEQVDIHFADRKVQSLKVRRFKI